MSRLLRAICWTGRAVLLASLVSWAAASSLAQPWVPSRADFTSELVVPNGFELGGWSEVRFCRPDEYVAGIWLKVMKPQGVFLNDSAATQLRLICTSGDYIPLGVGEGGSWSTTNPCPPGTDPG